jgi:hypothetical protein
MLYIEVAQHSLDAWDRRDLDAIAAIYAEGGIHGAPRAGQTFTGQAIANYSEKVFTAYPDFLDRDN